jgi:hypothetical protein
MPNACHEPGWCPLQRARVMGGVQGRATHGDFPSSPHGVAAVMLRLGEARNGAPSPCGLAEIRPTSGAVAIIT